MASIEILPTVGAQPATGKPIPPTGDRRTLYFTADFRLCYVGEDGEEHEITAPSTAGPGGQGGPVLPLSLPAHRIAVSDGEGGIVGLGNGGDGDILHWGTETGPYWQEAPLIPSGPQLVPLAGLLEGRYLRAGVQNQPQWVDAPPGGGGGGPAGYPALATQSDLDALGPLVLAEESEAEGGVWRTPRGLLLASLQPVGLTVVPRAPSVGCMLVGLDSGEWAPVAPGTVGQVWTVIPGGGLAWQTPAAGTGGGGGGTTAEPVTFTFTANGAPDDLFYYLGVLKGNGAWQNPQPEQLTITAGTSNNAGSTSFVTDRTPSGWFVNPADNNFLGFVLLPGNKFKLKTLGFRQRSGGKVASGQGFIVQGSDNGGSWTNLATIADVDIPAGDDAWVAWQIDSPTQYRMHRIMQPGNSYITCGELAAWGTLYPAA